MKCSVVMEVIIAQFLERVQLFKGTNVDKYYVFKLWNYKLGLLKYEMYKLILHGFHSKLLLVNWL